MKRSVSLVDHTAPPDVMGATATTAEDLGYGTVWTNETPGRDAFAVLGGWAAVTNHCAFGIGVAPMYVRPPLTAAAAAAGLAAWSGREVVLGVGSGHPTAARHFFGLDPGPPVPAVRAYVTAVRRLLAGEEVDLGGAPVRLPGSPEPRVRVVVAAMGPLMMKAATDTAHGVLFNWSTAGELARMAEACREAATRPFHVASYVRVAVADDPEVARDALAHDLAMYLRLDAYRRHLGRQGYPDAAARIAAAWAEDGRRAAAAAIPDEVLAELGIAGTPEQCRAGLDRYRQSGIDELVVRPVPVGRSGLLPAIRAGAAGQGGRGV